MMAPLMAALVAALVVFSVAAISCEAKSAKNYTHPAFHKYEINLRMVHHSAAMLGIWDDWEDATSPVNITEQLVQAERQDLLDALSEPALTKKKGDRRELKAVSVSQDLVLKQMASAWHYIIVAQYWGRATSCKSIMDKASKLLHAANGFVKQKRRRQAFTSTKESQKQAQICLTKLPSSLAKARGYTITAIALIKRSALLIQLYKPGQKRPGSKPRPKPGPAPWLGHNDVNVGARQGQYGNPIDDCWIGDSNWASNRQRLASCAVGYGEATTGGKGGETYVVTSNNDDYQNPQPGTLRYGVTRARPLWITFARSMTFQLDVEMIIYKDKTIDGRGVNIVVQNGPCFAVQYTSNVIVHGINFYNCKNRGGHIRVMTGPDNEMDGRNAINGYGLYIYQSTNVWIDHCSFSVSQDTHIDVIVESSAITISNCFFENQDKTILMGHNDGFSGDVAMRVTVMLNKFGDNLEERMPRGRFGKFHVLNNYYPYGWGIYAIGGSADPTFLSEGNFFVASNDPTKKEVTKQNIAAGQSSWKNWDWQSVNDGFANGAFFTESGSPGYQPPYSYSAKSASIVPAITKRAGPLACSPYTTC